MATETKTLNALYAERNKRLAANALLAGFSPRAEQVHDLRSYLSAIATMLWEHGLLIDDPNVATYRAKAGEFA